MNGKSPLPNPPPAKPGEGAILPPPCEAWGRAGEGA